MTMPISSQRPFRLAAMWLAALGPFFYLSYGFANHLAAQTAAAGRVPAIVFAWERHIPFWPWTIFPYWSINAFYALSLFICTARQMVMRHGLRLLTAQVVAVSCFMIWPLAFSFGQPAVDGAPALLFNALRGFDKPFNQAPSLHIALAVILWDLYRRFVHARWARVVLHGWAWLICASVLTTYQHHFIDIPTGALLGVVCVWLWPLEQGAQGRITPLSGWRRPSGRPLRLGAAYTVGAGLCWGLAWWAYAAGWPWGLWLAWPAVALALVALNYWLLGPQGFAMRRNGRMGWAARWLYAPYRLGAWCKARLWTCGQPLAHEVLPGLWLGRLPSAQEWHAAGRPRIVSLCAELQAPAAAARLGGAHCVPLLDLLPPTPQDLRRAAAAVQRMWQLLPERPAPLWVCCALGYSRSAATLAVWLVRYGHCATVDEALALIRRARPQVVLRVPYVQAIVASTAQWAASGTPQAHAAT